MRKAVILSSGGVDSTTCIAVAVKALGAENISTASIFYGQKHEKELDAARRVAAHYGVAHYEFDLSEIMKYSHCALLAQSGEALSHKSYAEQLAETGGRLTSYVPFRNGLMLSTAAALAASIYPDDETDIYIGAHADDAAGNAYADCSEGFLRAMGEAITIGTYGKVRIVAPFAGMGKAQVVAEGLRLRVPYELTWSCYEGGERPCGLCGTCRERAAAFAANGAADPALEVR